ncbi:MAG: hypothetical protein HY235_28345 [Acidobacteria bacterium]|nr:hypothetical protein [Acidobacteriota bacterium]
MRSFATVAIGVALATACLPAASGQPPPSGTGDQAAACMDCHAGSEKSKRGDIEIDPARYGASTHGAIGCTGCHMEGFSEYPHKATRQEAPDCTLCHGGDSSQPYDRARIESDVKQSIHARLLRRLEAGRSDPVFKCTNCHYPHYFLPVRKMASIEVAVRIGNETCMACHARPDELEGTDQERKGRAPRRQAVEEHRSVPAAGAVRFARVPQEYAWKQLASKHVWIPMWELHTKAARCVECHTPGKEETIHKILPSAQAQKDCVACHSRDSLLLHKLYRHIAKEEWDKGGIVNAIIFNNAYLIGATKFAWLDWLSVRLFGLALAAVFVHSAGRVVAKNRRR